MFPKSSVIRFDFPARGSMPPVKIFWYDGLKETPEDRRRSRRRMTRRSCRIRARGGGAAAGRGAGQGAGRAPARAAALRRRRGFVGPVVPLRGVRRHDEAPRRNPASRFACPTPDGSLFIGDKGMITTGTYGENTRLLPVEKMKDYSFPPPLLTRSPGHYRDWIRACKGGEPACSNFNVAGPFVEWMLLGVIALRVEGKLEWDPDKMRFTNNTEANKYVKPLYRKGWAPNWKG